MSTPALPIGDITAQIQAKIAELRARVQEKKDQLPIKIPDLANLQTKRLQRPMLLQGRIGILGNIQQRGLLRARLPQSTPQCTTCQRPLSLQTDKQVNKQVVTEPDERRDSIHLSVVT